MEIDYIGLLFDGGIDEVRTILIRHIRSVVRNSGLDPATINETLGLGKILPKRQVLLPTYEEVLSDPRKLTSNVLSHFECLELNVSGALGIDWRVEEKMSLKQIHEAFECCRGMFPDTEPSEDQKFLSASLAVQMSILNRLGTS